MRRSRLFCQRSLILFLVFLLPVQLVISLFLYNAPRPKSIYAQTSLNVPITVKESAGVPASDGFPTTVIVPLPYGQYQDTSTFRLTDKDGQTVRCQFAVLNRHWARDNSIRHLQMDFLPSIEAGGSSTYYLKNDGSGSSPPGGLTLLETDDEIAVNTGPLNFGINKNSFNVFDWVYHDGKSIITSSNTNGSVLTDRFEILQYGAQLGKPEITIEERGPVRAVIRIQLPAKFRPAGRFADLNPGRDNVNDQLAEGDYLHEHGYCVRIYAYEGKSYVKVDFTLENSDKTVLQAWPLYFRDMSLAFALPADWNDVTIGVASSVYSGSKDGGKYIYQDLHNSYKIYDHNGTPLSTGEKAPGWLNISGSAGGMMVAGKDFWQTWPNALEVEADGGFRAWLFPKWGQDWYMSAENKMVQTDTDLYWLEDMQHVTKTYLFDFHDGTKDIDDFTSLNKLFQKVPVGVLPTAWYEQTGVTFDMGGMFPVTETLPSPSDTEIIKWPNIDDVNTYGYGYGYDIYLADVFRRAAWTSGGWPRSSASFYLTGNPKYYYTAEAMVRGDMNARAQMLTGFSYPDDLIDGYSPVNENPYTTYSWRYWKHFHGHPKTFAPYLEGTDYSGFSPRDTAHMWNYFIDEYYYFTGDKYIYDWYVFMGNFLKAVIDGDKNHSGFIYQGKMHGQTRSMGHTLSTLMQAYRIVGDPSFLETAKYFVRMVKEKQCKYGIISANAHCESPFHVAYLTRGIISLIEEIGDTDPQATAEFMGVLEGFLEWNYNYADFDHFIDTDEKVNYHSRGPIASFDTAFILVDSICWFYHHTGQKKYLDHLIAYMEGELGKPPIQPAPGSLTDWQGDFAGRWSHYLFSSTYERTDEAGPVAISDLAAEILDGGMVRLTFTGPADAVKYHIRWSERPIYDDHYEADARCNWWHAEAVGNSLSGGGAKSIDISGLPQNAQLYFAVKSFDETSNISPISNRAELATGTGDTTPPNAVTDLKVKARTETTALLEWTVPGDDGTTGTAFLYDLRIGTDPVNESSWEDAAPVANIPLPKRNVISTNPLTQTMLIEGLEMNIPYYVAMKSYDDVMNESVISNTLYFMLKEADVIPPADITDLTMKEIGLGGVTLEWTAPGDNGMDGQAEAYDLRFSTEPLNAENFDDATAAAEIIAPSFTGSKEVFTVKNLDSFTEYYFALKTVDDSGNWSGLSNVVTATTDKVDQIPPDAINDLRSVNTSDVTVELRWTTTGDDGMDGTAKRLELAYSTNPIVISQWSSLPKVNGMPEPAEPGTAQGIMVQGLTRSTRYYFAIRVIDHAEKYSPLSNILEVTTADAPSIAVGKPVFTNDEYFRNLPSNLVDGTLENPWVSGPNPHGLWVAVDLESEHELTGADMIHFQSYESYGHKIQVSVDGEAWETVSEAAPGEKAGKVSHAFTSSGVRYIRLLIDDPEPEHPYAYAYVAELKVYGSPSPVAGDPPGEDNCFIATAAFGSGLAPTVILLRQFRDEMLLTNKLGQAGVRQYYKLSPPLARRIAGHELLRTTIRIILLPVIALAYMIMHPWLLMCLVTAACCLILYRRRIRSKTSEARGRFSCFH